MCRLAALAAGLLVLASSLALAPAALAANQQSVNVALIPSDEGDNAGTLQTAGTVQGTVNDSFDQFNFTDVDEDQIDSATLSHFDTVVLNEVFTSSLTSAEEQALSQFVTGGGKLIIHDADGTSGNDYSWLPVPAHTGESCENCGNTGGSAQVVENDTLVSNSSSSPYYVDLSEFPDNSDAIGDANVLVTSDPRWDADMIATTGTGVTGYVGAYASDGGLIIYNGFDTDDIGSGTFPSGNDWLDKLWYQELAQQWNPDNLPHSVSVTSGMGLGVSNCGGESITIGVVSVCANSISSGDEGLVAAGGVVLDGGVAVGDGPVSLDPTDDTISVSTPAPISLLRSGGSVALGSASFSIDASGTTDPVSGATNVAKVTITGASLGPLGTLKIGGLSFTVPDLDGTNLYLDSRNGGGLIAAATLDIPLGTQNMTSGTLGLGFYAGTPNTVTLAGGAVTLPAVTLAPGWSFDGLTLSYQAATDTWAASGGLTVPIGSLRASGSFVGGALNSLSVTIGGQNVPLADTGFFFSSFGGGVSGIVTPPLSISANTSG